MQKKYLDVKYWAAFVRIPALLSYFSLNSAGAPLAGFRCPNIHPFLVPTPKTCFWELVRLLLFLIICLSVNKINSCYLRQIDFLEWAHFFMYKIIIFDGFFTNL